MKTTMRIVQTAIAMVLIVVAGARPSLAEAKSFTSPAGDVIDVELTTTGSCPVSAYRLEVVWAEKSGGYEADVSCTSLREECMCSGAKVEVPSYVVSGVTSLTERRFGWSLGVQASHFGVPDAEMYGGSTHAVFQARLGMEDSWQFHFETGPGVTLLDDEVLASVSSRFAAAYDFGSVTMSLGARHELIFEAAGDMLNSVFGGFTLDIELGTHWRLALLADLGAAFYAVVESTMSLNGAPVKQVEDVPLYLQKDIETSFETKTKVSMIYRFGLRIAYGF